MRTPEQLLEWVREQWNAHPDDYDPTDEQMIAFIEEVQRDAVATEDDAPAGTTGNDAADQRQGESERSD